MKKLLMIWLIGFSFIQMQAQSFHGAVRVEFEKTVYVRQVFRDFDNDWFENIKNMIPEQALTYHEFIGDTTRSLFRPTTEPEYDPRSFYRGFADKNVVYNDYRNSISVSQKPIFEETFLIQDSMVKIKWKLTSDTRMIAGFDCRKAIGTIDDSITVFAFYTDEILVKGGPESIQGLPGMVLGLGMPRIHTTWFATKVDVQNISMSSVTPATKGKKTDRQTMMISVEKVLKNWVKYGKNLVWNFLI